jgi:NTE family protein
VPQNGAPVSRRHWLKAGLASSLGAPLGAPLSVPLLASLIASLSACAPGDVDHRGPDAPSAGALPKPPRTAWVFSSGGPRGYVHVGVLKGLAELGLAPDLVVGSSVGALIGVLCASGRSAAEIEALALDAQPWKLAGIALGGSEWLSGAPLASFMREQAGVSRLEQLPVPAVCVAKRIDGAGPGAAGGDLVAFNRGDLGVAVQAACAIEGRFAPVRIRGQRHVDADLHMPMPVRVARTLGATRVLAVDASAFEDRAPAGAEAYREGDLRKRTLTAPDAALATVLLHPDFGYWAGNSREYRQRLIDVGYRAALAAAAPLQAMHGA